ncbi:MAG: response regulator [Anaerolineae bacterium]|nr:response regulator [Anaerolineae bacterium]
MYDEPQDIHLLIVDDEPANLRLLALQFEAQGFMVHRAENGEEALHATQTHIPDLILLDIMLPDMDGYEVCAALKADPTLADIPVIFLSALYEAKGKAHALAIGGVDYVTKPFHFTELIARVQLHIRISRHQAEIKRLYRQLQQYTGVLEEQVTTRTRELKQAKVHVEAILESSSDVIILTDTRGIIQQANAAFYRLFGTDIREVLQQPLTRFFDATQTEVLQDALAIVVSKRTIQRMEITAFRHKNGTPLAIGLALSPVADAEGVISGVVCNLRDISQQKQLEANLRAMFAQERELREMQSHFLEIVSHEFRTPLTVIQSASEMLSGFFEQLSPEKRAEKLQQIMIGVKQVVSLLEHVITLDRARAGRYELRPVPIDIEPFCEVLIRDLVGANERKNQITLMCPAPCPMVITDETLLRLILRNLLSNAIKFAPPDKAIEFEIVLQSEHVLFVVRDQGMGIPEADQRTIFDIFKRASNVGAIRGTGLGLAIIKQSVDLLGGTVTFDSTEHVGTKFYVTLPNEYGTDL